MPALVICFGILTEICVRKAVRCLLVFSASDTSLFMSFCFSDFGTFSPSCGCGAGGGGHLPHLHPHQFKSGFLSLNKSSWAPCGSQAPGVQLSERGCFRGDRLSRPPGASPMPPFPVLGSLVSRFLSSSKGSALMKCLLSGSQKCY